MFASNVIKSPKDTNNYYTSVLPNGIKYLIIHDPSADRSACSLDVGMGSLYNPNTVEGLAHCVEHVLFLGTEKYPSKNEFSDFLSKNSGSTNAYTSLEATNFHFDVANGEIKKALDMFSQFFISPLFTKELIESELNAIDSEYKMDVRNDEERLNSIKSIEGYSNSEYSKFVCGNLQTLKRNDIRDQVIEFYKKHYNPTKMSLCVISDIDIEHMKQTIEECFSNIKQEKEYEEKFYTLIKTKKFNKLYDENNMGNIYRIEPVKDVQRLQLYWVINDNGYQYYKSQPFEYVTSLIGHEGKNSLTSYLKEKQYISSLTSSYNNQGEAYIEFELELELTDKGFENFENVLEIIMFFIQKMQSLPVNENYFKEIQKSAEIDFEFFEKDDPLDTCISLAENLGLYPAEEVIKVNYIFENYSPELIKKCFNCLTEKNLNIYLLSKKFNFGAQTGSEILTDKWFGTKYTKQPLSTLSSNLRPISLPNDHLLNYPNKNIFIPSIFSLVNFAENGIDTSQYLYPKKIVDNRHTIWYKPDTQFKIPKCYLSSKVYISNLNLSINLFYVYSRLYHHILTEEQREEAYMGVLSQNSLEVNFFEGNILINVIGFSDTIENYVRMLMAKMKTVNEDFSNISNILPKMTAKLQEMIKHLSNQKLASVEIQSYIKLDNLLIIPHASIESRIKICETMLQEITTKNTIPSEFLFFVQNLFTKTKFDWLVQGNILPNQAERIISIIETNLTPHTTYELSPNEIRKFRVSSLPDDTHYSYTYTSGDKENENSCVISFIQIGNKLNKDVKIQSLIRIIEHIFDEDFFDDLRTRQQLGYHVSFERHRISSLIGFVCFIQSSKYHPDLIVERINTFFSEFELNDPENFTDEDFESYTSTVINNLKEKDLTLSEEFERNFAQVISRDYQFDFKEQMIKCIQTEINKKDVIDFFNNFIYKKMRRIDIKCIGINSKKEIIKKENDKMEIEGDESNNDEESESSINDMPSIEHVKNEIIEDIDKFHQIISHFDELHY